MTSRAKLLDALEARIGRAFNDRALLDQALTHVSARVGKAAPSHNERLEFLGDRVLGLLAAEMLIALDPQWREGELSRRHAALVSGEACAQAARRLELGDALRLARGTSVQGGRDNARILGDALEALIAATYLDGGLAAARSLFDRAWGDSLAQVAEASPRDPKTALQEWAMSQALPLPAYRQLNRTGPDHAPEFTVEVTVAGREPALGVGASLRGAEKTAALVFLTREGSTA